MLNTLTSATFQYRGHTITARRMVDSLTGKFFCWQGYSGGREDSSIAHKSLNKFEEQFKQLADTMGDAYESF
ncbi:MAG: hypothetical protein IJG24_05205 [Selenomonadaceae bacterium]|nr:hypothetical protein [Selenomonadaceae bacterium]